MLKRSGPLYRRTARAALCLLLALTLSLAGLTASAEPAGAAEETLAVDLLNGSDGYTAILYDNTNGLSTSEANAIAQTADGFLWIGSYGGLIRYDGSSFERIRSQEGISSIVALYADADDRLWVGTNDSGIAVLEKGAFHVFNKADGLRSLFVCAIAQTSDGDIYIGTTQGVARIDKELTLHVIDEPQINSEYIHNLCVGADDVLYGRTQAGDVFTMKEGKLTGFYDSARLGVSGIHCLVPDPGKPGCVYLGTTGSELYYGALEEGAAGMQKIDVSPMQYLNAVVIHGDQLWLCADNGIGVVEDGAVTRLENLPLNSSVECMLTDYQGNLWFASSKQGVMKIVPNPFADVFAQAGLSAEVVNSTCELGDQLWIGRKSSGLAIVGPDGLVEHAPLSSAKTASGEALADADLMTLLAGSQIRSFTPDSEGRLWIACYGKYPVIRYEAGSAVAFGAAEGMPSERVRTVVEGNDGAFYAVGTGGLTRIENDRVTDVYGEASGIRNTEILTVALAPNGDRIVGTDGDGIYIITDAKVVHLGTDDGLSSEVVMRIKKDRTRDLFWIVTSNSLAYMDADYTITTLRDFPYANNFDLYENSVGEMWVLSSNGVYVASVEDMIANESIPAVLYNRRNGLPCIPTANAYSDLTADGELYIAGTTGVARINIEQPFADTTEVKMAVPCVAADGVTIYSDEDGVITVPSDVQKLTVYSYVFTYSLMDPQVTYWLDGFESQPTTLRRSEMTPVDYTNLSGGRYRFVMRLTDSRGGVTQEYAVTIVKQKAVYEELWFNLLGILLAATLLVISVWLYFRGKTRRLLKRQAEQKEIIKQITEVLAKTIDMKDRYTNGHSIRVAHYTAMLARELGYDEETVDKFYNIALLHDIGKISIPPEVLNKNGKLEEDEYRLIQSHAKLGFETLKDIRIMPELAVGAGAHHERPDGKGYPNGLTGEQIPRVAQIIAVADTFDAMYSDRPYRKRMNFDKVVSIMKEVSGTQLTADVVDAFLRLVDKGEMRAADDHGGGSTEDIDNIHRRFEAEEEAKKENTPPPETQD